MLLELKKAEDHFQYHIRRLIRAAKKKDLHLECFGKGTLATELHLNNLRNGPVHFRQEHECLVLVRKGDRLAQHLLHLNIEKELDLDLTLQVLHQKIDHAPLTTGIESIPQCYLPQPSPPLDEKLLTLSMKEWLDHFKSRYLIDVPKKMLYDGLLKKGLMYQCHLGEETNFNIARMSFFDHQVHQRGPNHVIHLHRSGQTLREMYLDPARVACSKIWDAKFGMEDVFEKPMSILLSDVLIFRCYEALEQHRGKNLDSQGWSWTRTLNDEDGLPSPRLRMDHAEAQPMLNNWIMEHFNTRILPPGEMSQSIESFLAGKIPTEQCLFIQDAHVEFEEQSLSFITTSSSLMLNSGQSNPILISEPMSFSVQPEKISESISSKKLKLYLSSKSPPAWLPSYILMDGVQVQKVNIK